jgi:hypothetical protein
MTWDDAQVERLRELAAHPDKLSASQIADRLGWPTRNAVIGVCKRRGIRLPQRQHVYDPTRPRKPRGKARSKTTKLSRDKSALNPVLPKFKREPFKARDVKCEPLHLPLHAKSSSQCSFPYGDGPFTFCCLPVVEGYSYCPAHKELCLVKPVKPSQSKPFHMQRGRAA